MAESPAYPGAPRWVKILGIVSLALVVAFVVVHLAGGGFRHHGGHFDGETPPAASQKSGN
jgi:hypothetical protein